MNIGMIILIEAAMLCGIGGIVGNLLSGVLIGIVGLRSLLFISFALCLAGAFIMAMCARRHHKHASL